MQPNTTDGSMAQTSTRNLERPSTDSSSRRFETSERKYWSILSGVRLSLIHI